MVEDDDEFDQDSVYGSRRDTTNTMRSFNNEKLVAEHQNQVDTLQGKLTELEKQMQDKDATIRHLESAQREYDEVCSKVRSVPEHANVFVL
jgi:chromosome segregation ATPase